MLELAAAFICFTSLLTYLNYRFVGLPPTIGVMVIALIFSVGLQSLSWLGFPGLEHRIGELLGQIDFNDLLMNWMLGFLLFAGALHVNLKDLRDYKWAIGGLATLGVIISTVLIGYLSHWIFGWLGWHVDILYCLIFGALISPTDPIAVLGILRSAGAPKSLETTIVGEALFNDGVAVVVYSVLLGVIQLGEAPTVNAALWLFVEEAGGGILFGLLIGFVCYWLMLSIEQHQIEVMLSLALVIGGSTLASHLHVSGPIAMVVAGLIIGNLGRTKAMNDFTRRYLDGFWELIDEILNALLFALIGMELLVLPFSWTHLGAALLVTLAILFARWISVAPVVLLSPHWRNMTRGTARILTWGALRGGVSVALALSLPAGPERDLILALTYIVVLVSILGQGLTIGRVVKSVTGGAPVARDDHH